MYIGAFWFGVIATLAAEFMIAVIHVVVSDIREAKSNADEEEKSE